MTTLLHLGPTERQLWTHTRRTGWQPLSGELDTSQPVWVVTDLAEESLVEVEIPRLYGRDRANLISRQLIARFPDTPYRSRLNATHGSTLLDRLAPVRHTLFGIAAAERLNSELDSLDVSVAALCPTTLLLTRFGQHKSLPDDLFVVLPGPSTLRIVFIKNRIPTLTRLAAIPNDVTAQAEEIIRTHRYLENTRLLQRGTQPPPVLILGNAAAFSAPLAAARLELAPVPAPWNTHPPADWRFPLFDLALREQPYGQLAPIERRTIYFAHRLHKAALVTAAVCVLIGLAVSGIKLLEVFDTQHQKGLMQATSQRMNEQIDGLERKIATFAVPPELVRRAVTLDEKEILSAPSIVSHLHAVGDVIGGVNLSGVRLRLSSLEWHLLDANVKPCEKHLASGANSAAKANIATDIEPAATTEAQRKVELAFEVTLPETLASRGRASTLHDISTHLARINGASLLFDPDKELVKGTLRGGALPDAEGSRTATWCMTLPGTSTEASATTGKDQP